MTPSQRVSPPRPRVQPEPPELPNAPTRWDGRTGPRPQAPDRPSTTTPGPRRPVDAATVAQHAVRPDPTGWTGPPPQSFRASRDASAATTARDAGRPASPPAAAPVPSGARRRRVVVPPLVVGALVVAVASSCPACCPGRPRFELVSTVAVGGGPSEVALSPDGNRAYVTNRDIGAVTVIDTTTRRAVDPPVQVGPGPDAVLVAPDGRRVYVADSTANQISVLDTATNTVAATIPVGRSPEGWRSPRTASCSTSPTPTTAPSPSSTPPPRSRSDHPSRRAKAARHGDQSPTASGCTSRASTPTTSR